MIINSALGPRDRGRWAMALPLVLAGPVVRRVDARSATFWMALSEAAGLEAWVWPSEELSSGAGTVRSGTAPVAFSLRTAHTRRLGDKLHVATVTAEVQDGGVLPPGTLCSYDIGVGAHGGLRDLGLLEESSGAGDGIDAAAPRRLALGYDTDRLPGFVTCPPLPEDLRIAHASCRKPHGLGPDAMPWLDDLIARDRTDLRVRPQQLFLTGDQIYADDVAASLLHMLGGLAAELLGFDETVPMPGAGGAAATRVKVRDLPPLRRARVGARGARLSGAGGP